MAVLRILQWNCRAISTAWDLLVQHLADNPYEVLALQSLGKRPARLPTLPGYHYPPFVGTDESGEARVATYVSLGLAAQSGSLPDFSLEEGYGTVTSVTIGGGGSVHILNYYNPERSRHLGWMASFPDDWVVVGDFNRRDALWDSLYDRSSPSIATQLDAADMVLLNDGSHTRLPDVVGHSVTAIDLSFVSSNLAGATDWTTLPDPLSSDHLPICVTIHLSPTIHPSPVRGLFAIEKADWAAYQTYLVASNYCPDLSNTVDDLNAHFTNAVLEAARHAIPLINTRNGRRGHPWWTAECKLAVASKRQAYHHYMTEGTVDSFTSMKATKAQCKRTIAKAKLAYWRASRSDDTDLTGAWRKFKILKSRYNPPDRDQTAPDGKVLHTPEEKAEGFLRLFAGASSTANLPETQRRLREEHDSRLDLSPPEGADTALTLHELRRALRTSKATKKSPGIDGVTYPLLQRLPSPLLEALLAIFNKCWSEGVVPEAWKHAIVVPIPKAGKHGSKIANHRPVSLTSHVSKVYERIVLNRLIHHVELRGALPKHQAAFRKKRSLVDHVVRLSEHVRRAQRQKRILHTCFLDIAKAFDTVWHSKLLSKLKSLGVSPALYNFVRSFLSGRHITVRWRGALSTQAPIDMGVPQGSVVAPLLFTLLIADVGRGVRGDTVVTAYADDIALWRKSRHRRPKRDSAQHKSELRIFQQQVDLIMTQLTDLGFSLSAAKTVYMPVHQSGYNRGTYPDWNHITVCGTPVKPAASVRFLGVIFQRDGRWSQHIRQVTLNARRALNLVRVIRREPWGQHREALVPIIQSLVRSRLLFGAPVLHDLPPEAVHCMVRVECRALSLGLGLPQSVPHAQIYNEAGILPLWHRLKRDACRYLFGSAQVPNSTEEELHEDWVSASSSGPIHGLPSSVRDLCLKAGLHPDDRRVVAQCQVDPYPPWALKPPEVEVDIPGVNRQDSPHLLLSRTRELLASKYAGEFLVYTDGSVLEDGRTGAGIFFQSTRESHQVKLSPATILTAELVAIREALGKVLALPRLPPRVTILSDSQSSLIVLRDAHCTSQPDVLSDILLLSAEAAKKNVHLKFQWVPSHVGLHGNEMADNAAKRGALAPEEDQIPVQLTARDAFRKIDHAAWDTWKAEYATTAASRGWPTLPCPLPTASTHLPLPPHISAMVSRIRVNHWRTQYTGTICACGMELVSFRHCLFFCQALKPHFLPLRALLGNPTTALDRLRAESTSDAGRERIILAANLTCSSPVGALV